MTELVVDSPRQVINYVNNAPSLALCGMNMSIALRLEQMQIVRSLRNGSTMWTRRNGSIVAGRFLSALLIVSAVALFTNLESLAQNGVIPPGSPLPLATQTFGLSDGSSSTLAALQGETATIVVFWTNKCPWCTKVESRLEAFVAGMDRSKVALVLVNSNDGVTFPAESATANNVLADKLDVPYITDSDGTLKNAFGAARAPHFFVFDGDGTLVYLGSFDDSPGDEGNVEASYVADAISSLSQGTAVSVSNTKAFGCMIKAKR